MPRCLRMPNPMVSIFIKSALGAGQPLARHGRRLGAGA